MSTPSIDDVAEQYGLEQPTPGDLYGRLAILHQQCAVAIICVVILAVDVMALAICLKIVLGTTTTVIVPGVVDGGSAIPTYVP